MSDRIWKAKYDSDGASLIEEFYGPALASAVQYDRTTGYFSAGVLTLASRGVEALARAGGRMRLVVGCTLSEAEAEAITRGESLKDQVETRLAAMPLKPESATEKDALELLSYMVARGSLEVRVAIPCDAARRPVASQGLFHEKAGIVVDKTGDRVAFNGSINETPQGWAGNWESFHAFTSWTGEDGRRRVEAEEDSFGRLWANKAKHCVVIDVPTAVREDLLRFLPPDDLPPKRLLAGPEPAPPAQPTPIEPPSINQPAAPPSVDLRRLVWGLIQNATQAAGGDLVGEAGSIVTPWPHQIRTFDRVYRSWPPRLLIADEVGLGKTIEAGLILRQAWLAGRARRVLVLAPKAVLTQWQIELREKFNLNWPIYDGQKLSWYDSFARGNEVERKVSRSEWHLEPFVLTSSQLMRRLDRAPELLDQAEPWDLVVLDEAHHARRKGGGTGKDQKPNQLLTLMQALRPKANGLLLLTATPMQVSPIEIWDLLNLLGLPQGWDAKSFEQFFEKASTPNPSHDDFEFLAGLFRQSEAHFGDTPDEALVRFMPGGSGLATRKVVRALRDPVKVERKRLEADRRAAAVRMMQACSPVRRLISRHTRELLRRYFKAGKMSTPIPTRAVEDRFVTLSIAERRVYERVEDYISTTYNQARPDQKNAVGFVMTIYRRRLASSFEALAQTLAGRVDRVDNQADALERLDDDVNGEEVAEEPLDSDEARQLEIKALQAEELADLAGLLGAVRELPPDTKLGYLFQALRDLKTNGHDQTLIFTQYTDTLDFLRDQLVGEGWRVMCFSGRGGELLGHDSHWRTISRDDVKREFRAGNADILLCTDAAAEGLNFQFCGSLVNYDMPWNPMRVEQRIGRIDRLGQKFPEIRIINLHYQDTVETDVYIALRERIGLFTKFVGKLQPILASLPRSLATATLARGEDRARVRDDLLSRLSGEVRVAEEAGFDLDAILESDLEEPERPEPPYRLADLEEVLRRPELLPAGVVVKRLGPGQWDYRAPGLPPLRVTTRADLFDEHPGSLELWSPGSPTFPRDVDAASFDEVALVAKTLQGLLG